MTAKRESPFPSTSIGRTQGAYMSQTASFETLSAHPLLSSAATTASPSTPAESQPATKYIPYTPRHRVPSPSITTTGTTVDSSLSQQHHGAATTKLQLTNLKAAARDVGLKTTSVGWAMLEKIVYDSDHSAEWTEVWSSITTGKASLLLPLEDVSSHEKISHEFVKDHIVLCDGSSRNNAPIVTLSGLRGLLAGVNLTFRSSLSPPSKSFQDLLGTFSRSSALAALPPLTLPSTLPNRYPSFSVSSYVPALPLPPRIIAPGKPPLHPRPNSRTSMHPSSRLSSTFTSLFGKTTTPTPSTAAASPSPQPDSEHTADISAFVIDRRVILQDVSEELDTAIKSEVEDSLAELPSWVIERVHAFTQELYPFLKAPAAGANSTMYVVNPLQETPEAASQRFQDFYALLEQDLRLGGTPFLGRNLEPGIEDEAHQEQRIQEKIASEGKIRDILETVERTVCSLFYDRIYLQSTSDDASHDETLSSRVAALNMLDLTLEHLDVHVGDAGPELDRVVKACGHSLSQLDSLLPSPADKAAILVAAHKVVVDGLSKLSTIRLKSEAESEEQQVVSEKNQNDSDTLNASVAPKAPYSSQLNWLVDMPTPNLPPNSAPPPSPIPGLVVPEGDSTSETSSSVAEPQLALGSPPLALRPHSPPATNSTPISGDILLPLIIYSVVKANPPHLVSHLLYTQRFRNQSVGGEESYCLINLMAVAEFLENVDLAALGLADSENKVLSAASLTPIPINLTPIKTETPSPAQDGLPGSLRGRVEQQVDAIAGSANKVISGVVDSFGMLRLLLPGQASSPDPTSPPETALQSSAPWNVNSPRFGLLQRENGFSIASIAASLPGAGGRGHLKSIHGVMEEAGQPLLAVSRPSSARSGHAHEDQDTSAEKSGEAAEGEKGGEADLNSIDGSGDHDARSLQSFESMMNGKSRDRKDVSARKSLSDRLANMSGLARLQYKEQETSFRFFSSSLRPPAPSAHHGSPGSSRPTSPASVRVAPPNQRFLECTEDDIKVSEVGELLREYKRVVEALRASDGFDD